VLCPCCGNDVASVEREIRMGVPDAVLAIPEESREARVRSGGSFCFVDRERFFVRGLLPVRLSDGHEFRFGVWLELPEAACRHLAEVWDRPEYLAMRFDAVLANSVPPWDAAILDAPCVVSVREQDSLPFVESSAHPELARILTTPWPRAECEAVVDQIWGREA
jgi:hypothetical protein